MDRRGGEADRDFRSYGSAAAPGCRQRRRFREGRIQEVATASVTRFGAPTKAYLSRDAGGAAEKANDLGVEEPNSAPAMGPDSRAKEEPARNIRRICLAGSGRGQVQGVGCAQREQSFQEPGRWPELLTAGLYDTDQYALGMCALLGTIAAPDLAGDYHGTNGLFGPVVRRLQPGAV